MTTSEDFDAAVERLASLPNPPLLRLSGLESLLFPDVVLSAHDLRAAAEGIDPRDSPIDLDAARVTSGSLVYDDDDRLSGVDDLDGLEAVLVPELLPLREVVTNGIYAMDGSADDRLGSPVPLDGGIEHLEEELGITATVGLYGAADDLDVLFGHRPQVSRVRRL
jgi:hypothetical protein